MKSAFKKLTRALRIQLLASDSSGLGYYYEKNWKPKPDSIDKVIDDFSRTLRSDRPITFIQVGSNDGFQNDPICKFIKRDRWKGALIEPQEDVFPTLQKIYRKNDVSLINKAIAQDNLPRKFYRLSISNARWATGLSSFVRDHIQAHIDSGYVDRKLKKEGTRPELDRSKWIEEVDVQCTTFQDVLQSPYFQDHLSLLVIDTEGFDYEILKLFPFDTIQPLMIIYEAENLSSTEKRASEDLLQQYGYELRNFPPDNVASLKLT